MTATHTITALVLATAIASADAERRELRLADCPEAVRTTIQANARDGVIDEVDLIAIEGKRIYIAEVDLKRGRDLKIYVNGDGALVKTREDIALRELPQAVADAVKKLGGTVDDVEKEVAGDKVTFVVEIDRQGQPDLDVVLAADGAVVSQTEDADE